METEEEECCGDNGLIALGGVDSSLNQDATWLLTSSFIDPCSGPAFETFIAAPEDETSAESRLGLVNKLDLILKWQTKDAKLSRVSEFPKLSSLTSENPEDQDLAQYPTKKSAMPHEESPALAAHLIRSPPLISPPKLASTPSYKDRSKPKVRSTLPTPASQIQLSPVTLDIEEVADELASLSFDEPPLNATKDIIEGGRLNVTKPSILTKDLIRTQALHELEVVNANSLMSSSQQASFPAESSANITHNVDTNRTQNLVQDLNVDASETLDVDLGINSEINLEPSTISNLTQLASLTSNPNLPCEEDAAMGAEQKSILTLEKGPFKEKSKTTFTAQSPQSQNEMDLTQTITKHIQSVDRTRSLSMKDNPSQESHDETSTTYNILRETTNLDPNQRQSRTVVKKPASTQEKKLKASIQSKNPGGTCGSTLSKKIGDPGRPQMAQNPFKQPEKVPKSQRRATANMVKQRSLGYLNPPTKAVPKQLMADRTHTITNSKQSMDNKNATNLSTKLNPLKRQSSAGSGVRVLAPAQLLRPASQPRAISSTQQNQNKASAQSTQLRPLHKTSLAGTRLRLPRTGSSSSRLPVFGSKL